MPNTYLRERARQPGGRAHLCGCVIVIFEVHWRSQQGSRGPANFIIHGKLALRAGRLLGEGFHRSC